MYHDTMNKDTGHPLGKTITIAQLKPYKQIARKFLDKNQDHTMVVSAVDFLVQYLSSVHYPPNNLGRRSSPDQRLKIWRHRLWESGVETLDMLAVIVGMYLLRYYQDRLFRSDRHFWHQMVIRILTLAKPRFCLGSSRTYHRKVTVGERERFTDILKQTRLMTLGHVVATHIIKQEEQNRLPQVKGLAEPFLSSTTTVKENGNDRT